MLKRRTLLSAGIVLLIISFAIAKAAPKNMTPPKPEGPTMTYMDQDPKYPAEVYRIFDQMPEYEFYEPGYGRQYGYIENEALFPSEVEFEKYIFFRKSKPPPSGYAGYKYIALQYYYSKNLEGKTKEGNPVYVAHYVLVPNSFNDEIQNYMELPVYNPIANVEVPITIERTYRQFQKVTPIIEQLIKVNPNKVSTPQLKDPMLAPRKKKGNATNKTNATNKSKKNKTKYPINPKTKKPFTKEEFKAKIKQDLEKKKAEAAAKKRLMMKKMMEEKKKAFLKNINFGLIFPPHRVRVPKKAKDAKKGKNSKKNAGNGKKPSGKASSKPSKSKSSKKDKAGNSTSKKQDPIPAASADGRPPKPKMRIVRSRAEEMSIGDGGFGKPGAPPGPSYFVSNSMMADNMRDSTYYPPFKMDYPTVPSDAEVNIDDIGHAVIAKYIPPTPAVSGMKYTFFFLAPAKFKYPNGKRVYIPVYILVPKDELGRPNDMREMLFDHYLSKTDSFPDDRVMVDPLSGIAHTVIAIHPKRISADSYRVVKNKVNIETPMKIMSNKFFTGKKGFKKFLVENKLINPPDPYFERKSLSRFEFNKLGSKKRVKEYMKSLLYFKNGTRQKILGDAFESARKRAKKFYDDENEKRLVENRTILNQDILTKMKEQSYLKQKDMLADEELKAMRQILKVLNPNSTLLRNKSKKNKTLKNNKTNKTKSNATSKTSKKNKDGKHAKSSSTHSSKSEETVKSVQNIKQKAVHLDSTSSSSSSSSSTKQSKKATSSSSSSTSKKSSSSSSNKKKKSATSTSSRKSSKRSSSSSHHTSNKHHSTSKKHGASSKQNSKRRQASSKRSSKHIETEKRRGGGYQRAASEEENKNEGLYEVSPQCAAQSHKTVLSV